MAERKEYWTTDDGQQFDTKEEALLHERELKTPEYELRKKIEELEKKIEHLECENLKRITEISSIKNPFQINKDTSSPWMPRVYYGTFTNSNEASDVVKDILDNFIGGNNDR